MSGIKHLPLIDATIPNDGSVETHRLLDLPFEQVTPDIRLYYHLHDKNLSAGGDKRYGFDFYVAEYVGAEGVSGEPPKSVWDYPGVQIQCCFHGHAAYDGIRHIWMGDERSDNEGYLYYADVRTIIKVYEALDAMEQKYLEPEYHHRA